MLHPHTQSPSMSAAHAPAHAGAGGGGDDDDNDPSRGKLLNPTHTVDADPTFEEGVGENSPEPDAPPRARPRRSVWGRQAAAAARRHKCHVCDWTFSSAKSLHGHMRAHPMRKWRGSIPLTVRPEIEAEAADSLLLLSQQQRKNTCDGYEKELSHRNGQGCGAKDNQAPSRGGRRGGEGKGVSRGERPPSLANEDEEKADEGAWISMTTVRVTDGRRRALQVDLNMPPPPSSSSSEGTDRDGDGDGNGSSASNGMSGVLNKQ